MDEFSFTQGKSKIIQFIEDLITADMTSPSSQSMQSVIDGLKAHPEDLQSVISLLNSTLALPAKDWRRINKSLALILVMIRTGSQSILNEFKSKSEGFKQLVEFFYIENRVDKGGVVRDKARMIYACIANPDLIEADRLSPAKETKHWRGEDKPRIVQSTSIRKEEVFRQEEPKKVSMFQGINVKSSPGVQSRKPADHDLLGDLLDSSPAAKPAADLSKSSGIDLLSLSDPSPAVPNHPTEVSKPSQSSLSNILDMSLPTNPPSSSPGQSLLSGSGPTFPHTSGLIGISFDTNPSPPLAEPTPEHKRVTCNIGEQGPSLLSLKSSPNKPSGPNQAIQKAGPVDLESKLLNFDNLEAAPKEEKPPRSYFY